MKKKVLLKASCARCSSSFASSVSWSLVNRLDNSNRTSAVSSLSLFVFGVGSTLTSTTVVSGVWYVEFTKRYAAMSRFKIQNHKFMHQPDSEIIFFNEIESIPFSFPVISCKMVPMMFLSNSFIFLNISWAFVQYSLQHQCSASAM